MQAILSKGFNGPGPGYVYKEYVSPQFGSALSALTASYSFNVAMAGYKPIYAGMEYCTISATTINDDPQTFSASCSLAGDVATVTLARTVSFGYMSRGNATIGVIYVKD